MKFFMAQSLWVPVTMEPASAIIAMYDFASIQIIFFLEHTKTTWRTW